MRKLWYNHIIRKDYASFMKDGENMGQAITQSSLSFIDIFSIISSVFSIVLGIVAIYLSIVFYKMSDKASKEAEKSAANIEASVKKLETLFDKLYAGTFDMMKETVTDMRKYVYSKGYVQEESNEKIQKEVQTKLLHEVAATIDQIKSSSKSDAELQKIIMETIDKSKKAEVDIKRNNMRKEIIDFLKFQKVSNFNKIEQHLTQKGLIIKEERLLLFDELHRLAEEHKINNPFRYDPNVEDISVGVEDKIYLLKE